MLIAIDDKAAGVIGIADAPREIAAAAVSALHDLDVDVVRLTGDNRATPERIANHLGIDTVVAEVLPGDKAAKVAELQSRGRKVTMIGDGINDAPELGPISVLLSAPAPTWRSNPPTSP